MKLLYDAEPGRLVHAKFEHDEIVFEETIDTSPVAEAAKIFSDEPPGKDFRHLCDIPPDVWNRAINEGWVHDKKKWKQWYQDPDNRDFRVHAGRDTNFHAMGSPLIIGGK